MGLGHLKEMIVKIDRDLLKQLNWKGDREGPWSVVSAEITGTWRWGTIREVVLRHIDTEANPLIHKPTYWSQSYQVQEGDGYYNSLDDEGQEIELVQVWPHEKTIIEYKETPNVTT